MRHFSSTERLTFFSTSNLNAIFESRNLDIYVINIDAGAVVVLNTPVNSDLNTLALIPNSLLKNHLIQSASLKAQPKTYSSHRRRQPAINIVDQNGQFLYNIDKCDIQHPYGMFVGVRDNLYVTEFDEFNVKKKIKYFI